jgi:hypothetical protein
VQSMMNEALGLAPPTNHLSSGEIVGVVDVQIAISAVLRLGARSQ